MFLAEKHLDIPTVEVDLRNGEQFSETFRALNPDCTVPVLELDDGTCLTEVFAICQYLEDRFPEHSLFGNNAVDAALATQWNIKIEQQGLAAIAEVLRNQAKGFTGRALTGPTDYEQIPALVERGRLRAADFLRRLDAQLESNTFVAGEYFTIADITAMVFTDFAAWVRLDIPEDAANLVRWKALVAGRPSAAV
jgi:glutathione S-transferase